MPMENYTVLCTELQEDHIIITYAASKHSKTNLH